MSFHLILAPVAFAAEEKTDASSQFRENPDAKGKTSYTKMLLGIGIGVVASNQLVTCTNGVMYPSIIVLNAGGLIYILSEILGGKSHNDALKKKTSDLKMSKEKMKNIQGGEVQKEALESALANEKETLKFINKRKTWMTAITAIFMASTAAAAIEQSTFVFGFGLVSAVCIPVTGATTAAVTAGAVGAAFAFTSGAGLMGAAFGAGLSAAAFALAPPIATANNFAVGRIATGAAASVVSTAIVMDLSSKAKVTQGNIDKLEKALAEFNANSTSTTTISDTTSGSTSGNIAEGNIGTVSKSGTGLAGRFTEQTATSQICASSSSQGTDVSQRACSSPVRIAPGQFDIKLGVPTLNSFNQTTADVGNALAKGDLEGAEVGAASLAGQAARMTQLRDSLVAQANKKLIAEGKKPIDVNALAKEQLLSMSNAMKKSNPDGSAVLAGLAKGEEVKLADDIKETAPETPTVADKPAEAPTVTPNAAAFSEPALPSTPATPEKTLEEGLADFEYAQNDISDSKEDSIFKQVSNRYLLNYPSLVRRKSMDEVETPENKP